MRRIDGYLQKCLPRLPRLFGGVIGAVVGVAVAVSFDVEAAPASLAVVAVASMYVSCLENRIEYKRQS